MPAKPAPPPPWSPPADATLDALREAATDCRHCPLWERATQTVFGEGPAEARVVLVGEQPGDQEDVGGRPFVGPAGQLLDRALAEAGLDRGALYVTNAVKHFKWEPRGPRRLHVKPNAAEIRACHPWLAAELARLAPEVLVVMGATAAQSLFGRAFKVSEMRGQPFETSLARRAGLATYHPSYLLRIPDEAARAATFAQFVTDLRRAHELDGAP